MPPLFQNLPVGALTAIHSFLPSQLPQASSAAPKPVSVPRAVSKVMVASSSQGTSLFLTSERLAFRGLGRFALRLRNSREIQSKSGQMREARRNTCFAARCSRNSFITPTFHDNGQSSVEF